MIQNIMKMMTNGELGVCRIHEGDCLQILKEMPNNCVDLIITSPPYADARKKIYGGVTPEEYTQWFLPISQELFRVLKPTGSFILNIKEKVVDGERSTYVIELVLALKKQGWFWIEEYIWHKKNAMPNGCKTRFRDAWEHCYHFAKGKDFKINKDSVKIKPAPSTLKRIANIRETDRKHELSATGSGFNRKWDSIKRTCSDTVYPTNVLFLSCETQNQGHSAVYPISLPSWFIKVFSDEGDIVLDPFGGSGTTAVAAKELKRKYITIDIKKEYCLLQNARLNNSEIINHSKQSENE